MRNRLLIGATALALLALFGHFAAKPLIAQVRAALIKNIDERGREPFMVQLDCHAGSADYCDLTSQTAVPAHKRFVVEYINGILATTNAVRTSYVNADGLSTVIYLQPRYEYYDFGQYFYTVSMPVVLYFEGGQFPFGGVNVTGYNAGLNVTIVLSGYLVDLTQ